MKLIDDPQSVDPQTMFENFVKSSTMDRCAIFTTILAITAFVLMWPSASWLCVCICLRWVRMYA